MQLEGMEVSHMKFGEGKVMELEEKYITILFPQGEKKFLYPNSFNKFLTLKDPVRLKLNSACLLTECPKGVAEKRRRIIGAFMLQDNFESSACRDGIIQSHEKFRIQLNDKETLFYWDYFSDGAEISKWGNVELKYFSNMIMQKILFDMQNGLTDAERRKDAEEFYQYFCLVNKLKPLSQ